MSEIIDVITRLSYIAEDAGLKKSSELILTQTKEIAQLAVQRAILGEKQAQLAATDIAGQKKILIEIQKVETAIKAKTKAVINERISNADLNKELIKEVGYLNNIEAKLEAIKTKRAMATTASEVKSLTKEISLLESELKTITGPMAKGGGLLGSILGGVGLGAGVFSFQAIFGELKSLVSESTAEFEDAEKTALDLGRALKAIGQGKYFDGIISESDNLAEKFHNLFDNDDIIKAQTALVQYGKLSRNEMSKLLPVVLELATAEGIDLVQATEKVVNILEGRGGQVLRDYGVSVKGVKTEHDRLNLVLGDFQTKLKGSADVYAQTAAGIEQTNKVLLANIEEQIGEYTSKVSVFFKKAELGFFNLVTYLATSAEEGRKNAMSDYRREQDAELKALTNKQLEQIADVEIPFLNERRQENENEEKRLSKRAKSWEAVAEIQKKIDADNIRMQAIFDEVQRRTKDGTADDKPINPNAALTEEKEKKISDDAKKAAEKRKKEQAESDKLIEDAKLSLLEEEAREIAVRTDKHNEEEKKLRNVSKADRLAFEEAFQQDIADIHDKYNQKELARLDKQNEDINKKVDDNFKREAIEQAKRDDEKKKKQEKLESDNLKAIQDHVKEQSDLKAKGEKEKTDVIIKNFTDVNTIIQATGDAINAATQASLDMVDREISAQQKRIDRAKRYAERGGAELLEIEEERLNKLNEKREKFARRQLVVNNALTLSNAILAVATAAGETGAGAIAVVPAVLAVIAAGYAFATSLSEPQTFAEGVKSVEGPGTETSDSIPARLSRRERVMSAKTSKQYKMILDDIQDGKFQSEVDLINQIQAGRYNNTINYSAILKSANTTQANGIDNKLLLNINSTLQDVNETISNKPVGNFSADENGMHVYFSKMSQLKNKRSKY